MKSSQYVKLFQAPLLILFIQYLIGLLYKFDFLPPSLHRIGMNIGKKWKKTQCKHGQVEKSYRCVALIFFRRDFCKLNGFMFNERNKGLKL